MSEFRSVIVALGPLSSQFVEKLAYVIEGGPQGHGLIAVGIYDNSAAGPEIRERISQRFKSSRVDDISVTPSTNDIAANPAFSDILELQRRVQSLLPSFLLLVVDAKFVEHSLAIFRDLRVVAPQISMTALCFSQEDQRDANDHRDRTAFALLDKYTNGEALANGAPILEGVFVVKTNSPLEIAVGDHDVQTDLLAKSLAGVWSAPLYHNFNPTFGQQIEGLRRAGKAFIGLGVKTFGPLNGGAYGLLQALALSTPAPHDKIHLGRAGGPEYRERDDRTIDEPSRGDDHDQTIRPANHAYDTHHRQYHRTILADRLQI